MRIKEIAKEIHELNKSKGFYDEKDRNTGELLMLVTSELSEALEADRDNNHFNYIHWGDRCHIMDMVDGKALPETGTLEEFKKVIFEEHVKNTFEDEIADSIIRLLDIAEYKNIDIEWHIRSKVNYNKNRPRLHNKKY